LEIITAKKVKFSYATETEIRFALNGVDFTAQKGEFVCILGHNGSGKSTFAKHINALLVPREGTVTVAGMDTSREDLLWEIRRSAGMVFQNPDNQIVSSVVEEDVAFGPENMGVPQPEIVQRVADALSAMEMGEYAKRAPHMLSGGQKQRVAIAGVLAMLPEIIVFDEPTAMLDPSGRAEVMDAIRDLNKKHKKTVVLITHFMDEAVEADTVYIMKDGRVISRGAPRDVFKEVKILKSSGLTPPFAVRMYYALREQGADLGDCPLTPEELVEQICRSL
jgi:energy-coupling factor transport system ATP-binding protein